MLAALSLIALVSSPQTINGIKPILDPTPKFSQAYVKQLQELGGIDGSKPDMFMLGFYSMKVKAMMPLVQTKYTAAQIGVCGTILGLFDSDVSVAIKGSADRIGKGTKDFDSFTKEEIDQVSSLMTKDSSPLFPFKRGRTADEQWQFFAGAAVGTVCAYSTLWHISPKQPQLLKLVGEAVAACAESAEKPEAKSRPDVALALKGFVRFKDKSYDEATMREIGTQIELALRSSLAEKYRW